MSSNKFGEAWEEQETSIKWRDDMVFKLIALRRKYNNVFSGKRGSAREGWTTIASELGLFEHNYKVLQKKWQNLVQKYKDVKSPAHYTTNPDGQLTTTWIFYNAMDQLLRDPEAANDAFDSPPKSVRQVQTSDCDSRQMIDFDFSDDLSLGQDSSEVPLKKKKMMPGYESHEQSLSTQSVQYIDPSEPPQWFREFLVTYRQDEAKRMEALKSMHSDIMRLERKKCDLLQELISKLSADEEPLSVSPSPTNLSKNSPVDQPTSTLTVTMDQNDHFKMDPASIASHDHDDNELRTADDLENAQIIIRPNQSNTLNESLVSLSQSPLGGKAQVVNTQSVMSPGQGAPLKLVMADHPGTRKGGQPLFIKTTTSRGKLVVPMRKLVVPVSETSSSVCLSSTAILPDSVIASSEYHCIDATDTG